MKKKTILMLSISTLLGSYYIACSPSEKKVEQAEEKVDEAKQNLDAAQADAKARSEEWIKYKELSMEKTNANDKKIAQIREKMGKEKKAVQEKYDKQISDLENKNKGIKQRLTDFKNDSKESWDTLQVQVDREISEFDHDINGITVAIENFVKGK